MSESGGGLEFFRVTFDGERRQVELEPTELFGGTVAQREVYEG